MKRAYMTPPVRVRQTAMTERLRDDQYAQLAREMLKGQPLLPLACVALGLLGAIYVDRWTALVWSACMLASIALLGYGAIRFRGAHERGTVTRSERNLLQSVAIAQAFTTASFAALFWQTGQNEWNLLMLMIVMGSLTMAVSLTSTSLTVFPAVLAIYLAVALALCLWEGTAFFHAVAALIPIFFAIAATTGFNAYTRMRDLLVLGYERDALIAKLKTANRAKSDFMANMSHELRTPLNAILGFSEVMKNEVMGPLGSKLYRTYSGDIHASGQRLLGMVNDILDLARIEAGKDSLRDDRFSAAAIAEEARRVFGDEARRRGIDLEMAVDPGLAIRWDVRAAKQIAFNLMSNALKFTPAGGTITMAAGRSPDGGAWISLRDTGCGIALENQDMIFQSFGQGRYDLAKTEGSGLGLAIVRGLVEAHGASIHVDSRPGQGATFTIDIPANRVVTLENAAVSLAA
jgi:two-component system cell cycle sensor histidine kinase PleC